MMKKVSLWAIVAVTALAFASCGASNDYKSFVGTWGVEKIEYYNIDYAGNPIAASMSTYDYDPNDTDNGIQLIFREDKTGEMRDSAMDTIWIDTVSYIVNPDTILVKTFTYSYDKNEAILYMNMDYARTFKMAIDGLTENAFTYENEYNLNYMEKAYLRRISNAPSKGIMHEKVAHPHRPGALLGGR